MDLPKSPKKKVEQIRRARVREDKRESGKHVMLAIDVGIPR